MSGLLTPILDHAARHHGVVTRNDLADLGVSRHRRAGLVASGVLVPATANTFVVGGSTPTWRGRLHIARAEAGRAAMVSHVAAAATWDAPRIGQGAVEVTIPAGLAAPRRTVGVVHRRCDTELADPRTIDGLVVTSPVRTLFDVSTRLGPVLLDEILQDFCRRDLMTLDEARSYLDRWRGRGRTGTRRMEELLDATVLLPRCDSWLEARFLQLLVDHHVPLPRTQVLIELGDVRYRVDALWDEVKLVVELNGHETHATRNALSADAERLTRLGAAGYQVVAFTHDQVVGRPKYVVAQVGRRLASTGRAVA